MYQWGGQPKPQPSAGTGFQVNYGQAQNAAQDPSSTPLRATPPPPGYQSPIPPSGTQPPNGQWRPDGMAQNMPPGGQPPGAMARSFISSPNRPGVQGMQSGTTGGPPGGAPAPAGEMFGPQFGEKYGMEHIGQYDQPTMLETFAQQQMNGNNPYYDRLRQQGMDQINQQMVARGHGNSGGALAALGNFQGALGAAQFKDMGDLVGGASGIGLQRQGQGNQVATGIQNMQRNRTQDQFGNLSDLAHLGAGTTGGFYGQGGQLSGDAAMAGINAGANAAQLAGQGQGALPNLVMNLVNGKLARG